MALHTGQKHIVVLVRDVPAVERERRSLGLHRSRHFRVIASHADRAETALSPPITTPRATTNALADAIPMPISLKFGLIHRPTDSSQKSGSISLP